MPPRRRPWLRRSGVLHDPDRGVFVLCSGLHRQAHSWNDERFRRRGSEWCRVVAHLWHIGCPPQCSARRHFAWSGTWHRLVGARCARTSPKILQVSYRPRGPFLINSMPRPRNASIAPIGSSKKGKAGPQQEQKHRHVVIDPRRATTLTASSSFAESDQFCVNAIASVSYNRVRPA
jgi:hypothetical protein